MRAPVDEVARTETVAEGLAQDSDACGHLCPRCRRGLDLYGHEATRVFDEQVDLMPRARPPEG